MLAKRQWLAGIAGLGLLTALAQWGTGEAPPVAPGGSVAVAPHGAPAPAPVAILAQATAQPPSSRAAPAPLETLKAYNASYSYRAFVYEAMKKPKESWHQYASAALTLCERAERVQEAAMADPRQRAAFAALRQRCDMSPAERTAAQAQLFATRGGDFANDPVMQASFTWLIPENAAAERAAIGTLLDTSDPMVISLLAEPSRARQDGKEERATWFLGSYRDSGKGSDFDFAFRLALCDLGLDCGAQAPQTLLLCIEHNWCAASYGEALHAGLPGRYAQVQALAALLSSHLRSKNAQAFVEHTGK